MKVLLEQLHPFSQSKRLSSESDEKFQFFALKFLFHSLHSFLAENNRKRFIFVLDKYLNSFSVLLTGEEDFKNLIPDAFNQVKVHYKNLCASKFDPAQPNLLLSEIFSAYEAISELNIVSRSKIQL